MKSNSVIKKCVMCGKEFKVKASHAKKRLNCSMECKGKYMSTFKVGENAYRFKGGWKHAKGYICVGEKMKHRLIEEKIIGRPLKDNDILTRPKGHGISSE